ncbi:galactosylceramide sulfotransferase-like [Ptychodera flava]|uniref:galactosylceramide sulfotransferase-like n=1 Tax=Ptychodera flava TaxID=63121 RepID=UPI00396A0DDF
MGHWKTKTKVCVLIVLAICLYALSRFKAPYQRRESPFREASEFPAIENRKMDNNGSPKQRNVEVVDTGMAFGKTDKPCHPINKFVYIKTVKTGSSTLSTILFRYGLKNGLIAALQQLGSPVISYSESTENYDILRYDCKNFSGYNFIANHIKYHHTAMDNLIKDAKYFTILRFPYTLLRSFFFYFDRFKSLRNHSSESQSFLAYLKSKREKYDRYGQVSENENSLSSRLGIRINDTNLLMDEIRKLDSELDLVMLNEYYDESLILLKKVMCWQFEDIIYYVQKVSKTPLPPITDEMADIIDKLSAVDIQLYNHFNKTFWRKVERYDGNFTADLAQFRELQKKISGKCETERMTDYCTMLRRDALPMTKFVYRSQMKWRCEDP